MSMYYNRITAVAIMVVFALGLTTCKKEKIDLPKVKVLDGVITIGITKASVSAEVTDQGGAEVKSRGFVYGLSGGSLDTVFCGSGTGVYSAELNNLLPNTKYVYEAFAKNAGGVGTSDMESFTTKPLPSFTINVSASPSNGGTVEGGGEYEEGQSCTAVATTNTGYSFVNWTENGEEVSTEANYTFTVTGSRSLVARFQAQDYTINVSANPTSGGTVSGGGSYNHGQNCTVTATAATGYTFLRWTENGDQVSTDASYTFTVTSNRILVAQFQAQGYTINVSANPSSGGTVSGGGSYNHGQSCTVTATVASGYTFLRWTENGNQVSTDARYTFTVTSNRILVAQFQAQGYTINVSANPTSGGMVSGGGSYNHGQSCTVTATAATGYTFLRWTENGQQVSANANYTFTVTGNRTLVAQFQAQSYTINISANPSNGGNVSGGGSYNYGQSCTVHATANTGYSFTNWTENGSVISTNSNYTFTVNSNRTLVANFTQTHTVSVSANPSNGGTVSGGGTYNHGQSCTVIATAADGYRFTNWTENGDPVSTNANYTFTVNSNHILVANFTVQAPNTYNINVSPNPSTGGTVTGGGSYQQGQSCTVTATAATGYTFLRWTENGQQVSTNANYTFTVTGNRTLVAQFQAQGYMINVSANPNSGGTVSGGGSYNYGQSCTVTATAATGYTFLRWTENGQQVSTNASYTFTVTGNRTLVAQFQAQSYTINISANPSNGGSVSGGGSYNYGQSCTVHATTNTGYSFTNWTENGSVISTNSNYTFTVNSNRTLVANFTQTHTVSVSANPSNGGTVSGGGTYNHGQSCTVSAITANGYSFSNWTENGNIVSTNATYTFTVNSNCTLVANFILEDYTISVLANPSNGGSVSGDGTYNYGQSCTVHAMANTGFSFTNWTENGNVVSINATYTFTVISNRLIVANFEQIYPVGAINGLFSINANQQVYFSQGNLQYKASLNTWRFATNQWDYIGEDNSNISQTYNSWIDLFGWGTSGWNNGNTYYHPYDSNNNGSGNQGYGYGPTNGNSYLFNLTGSYSNADWGTYNSISNGGNTSNMWRTLTKDEWDYMLNIRNTVSGIRYVKGIVNNTNGLIILPDDWNENNYTFNYVNNSEASYDGNCINVSQWNNLESFGAVFLPAAGYRRGTTIWYEGGSGNYASSTCYLSSCSYSIYFSNSFLGIDALTIATYRYVGKSVRLVKEY